MQQTRRKVMVLHDVHSWTPGWSTNRENNKVTVTTDIDGEVLILFWFLRWWLRFIRIRLHNGLRTKFWKSMKRVSNHQKIYVKWKNCTNLSLWRIWKRDLKRTPSMYDLPLPLELDDSSNFSFSLDVHWSYGCLDQSIQVDCKVWRTMYSRLSYKTCWGASSTFVLDSSKCIHICMYLSIITQKLRFLISLSVPQTMSPSQLLFQANLVLERLKLRK